MTDDRSILNFREFHSTYYIKEYHMFYATGMIGATGNPGRDYNESVHSVEFPPDIRENPLDDPANPGHPMWETVAPVHMFTIGISLLNPWGGDFDDSDTVCADICQIGALIPDLDSTKINHGLPAWVANFSDKDRYKWTNDLTYLNKAKQNFAVGGDCKAGQTGQTPFGKVGDTYNSDDYGTLPKNACVTCWIGIPPADMDGNRIVKFRVRDWGDNDVVATYSIIPLTGPRLPDFTGYPVM